MPKRPSKASTVAGAIGAPPLTIVRSDEVSRSRASGASMSAMKTVIAPVVKVTRWRSMSSSAAAGVEAVVEHERRAGQQRRARCGR